MSDQSNQIGVPKEFVVVLRGPSAVMFKPGEELLISDVPSAVGFVNITYTTRYLPRTPEVTLPGQLWVDIRGDAPSLDAALEPFANAGMSMIPVLALSANAAIGELDIELGFDNTANITERDYFQSYIPPEPHILHPGRAIDGAGTTALLHAIGKHRDSERLLRGANQYRIALQSWRLGRETLSVAHLWMATEALTKAKVWAECEARGIAEQADLAKELGVDLKQLDSTIRQDFLLAGDDDAYKKAKQASDGFEHGFLNYGEIRGLSQAVRHRMARYVRNAILEMCGLDSSVFDRLTNDPFDKPLGYFPLIKYLRGKLIGSGDELPAPENAYPFMKWNSDIKSAKWEGDKFNVEPRENLTAEIAEGISFQGKSFEAWQAG